MKKEILLRWEIGSLLLLLFLAIDIDVNLDFLSFFQRKIDLFAKLLLQHVGIFMPAYQLGYILFRLASS